MPKIDPSVIDNIRKNVNIVDVIEHYIPVVRKGNSVKCLCPFHDDHDPSMSISKEKQIYKCFVCDSAGNSFSFVQDYEKIGFLQAVKKVAEIGNIPFEYQIEDSNTTVVSEENKRNYQLMADSCLFLEYQLYQPKNIKYLSYLKKRGLNDDIIKRFRIGFNPSGNTLSNFLTKKNYQFDELEKLNLSNESKNDVFRDRITFPLINDTGNVVGYTARSIDNDVAKYINTSTTDIYQKSHLVYNLLNAKPYCQKEKKVIICEGVMDVLAFAKVGIDNAVATLGTACTIEQLRQIRLLSSKIIVFYDGDSAGQAATFRLGQLASKHNIIIEVVDNHTDLDPDEIIEKHSVDELKLMCNKTINWIEFLLKYLPKQIGLNNFSEKKKVANILAQEISVLNDQSAKNYFLKQTIKLTDINIVLPTKSSGIVQPKVSKNSYSDSIKRQMSIINQLIKAKDAVYIYQSELGYLPDEKLNRLAILIINVHNNNLGSIVDESLLYNEVTENQLRKLLSEIVSSNQFEDSYNELVLLDAIKNVKKSEIELQIQKLKNEMKKILDPQEQKNIANKIYELKRKVV